MAEVRAFCPDCGSIDLRLHALGPEADCPNCGWEGPMSATTGAATATQFWDIEKIGSVMLRVVAIHAAGPLVQALEFIGLLPRKRFAMEFRGKKDYEPDSPQMKAQALYDDPTTPKWNADVQKSRDRVMAKITEAAITAAFEEAEKAHRVFAVEHDLPIHPVLRDAAAGDKVFGGNVVPMKTKRRRR